MRHMKRFTVETIIDEPRDIVARALTDNRNAPYWQTGLEEFEVIKGGPDEVGSIGLLHYRRRGKPYVMEDRLLSCEPGRKYVSEVSGDALVARVETTLEPLGDKTRITMKWEGKARVLPLKILFPFIGGRMAGQARKELDTLKRLIETRGADFSKSP